MNRQICSYTRLSILRKYNFLAPIKCTVKLSAHTRIHTTDWAGRYSANYISKMTFRDVWLMVGDVPTRLQSWGERPGEKNLDPSNNSIILFLCGNPGVTEFYEKFLGEIYAQLGIPVWAICHAGHVNPTKEVQIQEGVTIENGINKVYNVAEQVDHKAEFIRQFVPGDRKLYIIAHSFGAKITVELLKVPELRKRISKCYLLFPTLEHMRETPSGKVLHPLFTVYLFSTIICLSWIFTLFPNAVRTWMLKIYFMIRGYNPIDKNIMTGALRLIQPVSLRNVFQLALDEMEKIRDLDKEIITECRDKFKVFFGMNDGWAPLSHQERLKQAVPGIDSSTLDIRFKHDFVLDSSEEMAQIIVDQIKAIIT